MKVFAALERLGAVAGRLNALLKGRKLQETRGSVAALREELASPATTVWERAEVQRKLSQEMTVLAALEIRSAGGRRSTDRLKGRQLQETRDSVAALREELANSPATDEGRAEIQSKLENEVKVLAGLEIRCGSSVKGRKLQETRDSVAVLREELATATDEKRAEVQSKLEREMKVLAALDGRGTAVRGRRLQETRDSVAALREELATATDENRAEVQSKLEREMKVLAALELMGAAGMRGNGNHLVRGRKLRETRISVAALRKELANTPATDENRAEVQSKLSQEMKVLAFLEQRSAAAQARRLTWNPAGGGLVITLPQQAGEATVS